MLRRAAAGPEERVLVLASPFENAVLEDEGRDPRPPRRVQARGDLVRPVVHAHNEIGFHLSTTEGFHVSSRTNSAPSPIAVSTGRTCAC